MAAELLAKKNSKHSLNSNAAIKLYTQQFSTVDHPPTALKSKMFQVLEQNDASSFPKSRPLTSTTKSVPLTSVSSRLNSSVPKTGLITPPPKSKPRLSSAAKSRPFTSSAARSNLPNSSVSNPRPQALSAPPHSRSRNFSAFNSVFASNVRLFSSLQSLEITDAHFRCLETSEENHTERFKVSECDVILRRGNTLILKITTSLELYCSYVIVLTFVPIFRPRDRFGQFRAEGVAKGSSNIWLSISIPSNFPVGKFHAHISLKYQGGAEAVTYFHHKAIVILFNPWNIDDDTYMEGDSQKETYLLDDVGTIWRGTHSSQIPLEWEYGQFEGHCLDVALYLLRPLKADECRSAVSVCRNLISLINCRDNSGVLVVGKEGSNIGGIHPCRWTGSTAILDKYYRSKTPVRFGQCWVLAGVAVSLMRALGVVCRPITCYNAAHYCDKLGQINRYFSPTGDMLHDIGRDQTWIYHIWCEAWMRRDDLSRPYDGWQVLDPTSQERQSGCYRIGPAPVLGIKEGRKGKKWNYDVEFIQSEVGAVVHYQRVAENYATVNRQALTLAQVSREEIGNCIVTPSSNKFHQHKPIDITSNYKDVPTDSGEETIRIFPSPARDCFFEVKTNDGVKLGEDISITISVKNGGGMLRTIDGKVIGTIIHYTGQPVRKFMSMQFSGVISPGQSASVCLPIEAKKYMRNLVEQAMMHFFVAVKVRENKQLFLKLHPFQLILPRLQIQCLSTVPHGSVLKVKISFTNILQCSLSRVVFSVQGQALCPLKELSHKRLVLPGAVARVEFSLRANRVGSFTLLASMFCDQLADIRGVTKVTVVNSSL